MPGHNHYPWCTCGWCEKRRGGRPPAPKPKPPPRLTFQQITIPNASCPVCGARVFFYQNDYGSRVFFDELGPPWPKHPCTDNSMPKGRTQKVGKAPVLRGPVRKEGDWIPLRFIRSKSEDDWTVLYFEVIETDEFLRILTHQYANIPKHLPAYMRPWDQHDYTEIEYLDSAFSPLRIWGWKYGRWFAESAGSCLKLRRAQDEQAARGGK